MPTCPAGHQSAADDYCDACGRRMGGSAASGGPGGGPTGRGAPGGGGPTGRGAPGGGATISGAATTSGGATISGAATTSGGATISGGATTSGAPADPQPCPQCGTARSGRFCEVCRFDFVSGAPAAPAAEPDGRPARPPGTAAGTAADIARPTRADGPPWSAVVTADRAYFDRVVAAGAPEAATITFPPYCPERRFVLGLSRPGEQQQIGRHSASRGLAPEIDLTGPPTDPGISRLHAVLIGQPEGGWAVLDPGSENGTFVNDQEIATGVQVPLRDGDRIHLGAWTVITIRRA